MSLVKGRQLQEEEGREGEAEGLGLGAVALETRGLSEASLQTCWGKINT